MTQSISENGNQPQAQETSEQSAAQTPQSELSATERAKDLLMGKPMTAAELARGMASGGDINHPDRGTGSAQDTRSNLSRYKSTGD